MGCFCAFQVRYYYFNKYNVHARKAMTDILSIKYNEKMTLRSVQYEVIKTEINAKPRYIYVWDFEYADENERLFHAYLWLYGYKEKDGMYYEDDYYNYSSDTYGQLRMEESFDGGYDLAQYRYNKDIFHLDEKDYCFICNGTNCEEIAKTITDIIFEELTFCPKGGLCCVVEDTDGGEITCLYQHKIKMALRKQNLEMTYDNVQDYIMDVLSTQEE